MNATAPSLFPTILVSTEFAPCNEDLATPWPFLDGHQLIPSHSPQKAFDRAIRPVNLEICLGALPEPEVEPSIALINNTKITNVHALRVQL